MKPAPIAAALLLLGCPAAWAGASPPHPLLKVERARFDALVRADIAALDALLADELVYIHGSGIRESKQELLDAIRAGDIRYLSVQPLASQVRDRGSWAIVTGLLDLRVARRGEAPADRRLLYTAVYQKIDRRWQLVSWQTTRAQPSPP